MNATIVKKVSDMWTHLSVVSKTPLPLSEVCVFAVLYFFLHASCEREGGGGGKVCSVFGGYTTGMMQVLCNVMSTVIRT